MILGCYYLTKEDQDSYKGKIFGSYDDANIAFQNGNITLHTQIRVRGWGEMTEEAPTTTYGRIVFHHALYDDVWTNCLSSRSSSRISISKCHNEQETIVSSSWNYF